jgi:membrane protein DedA with SNARE-associated domain
VTIAGTIGATAGALVAYAIGYFGGRPALIRYGRYLRISEADLERTEAFFERHGTKAAFFGRLVPVVRSLVSFAAGLARMPLGPFVAYTALGSLPFTFVLVVAGMSLGANWDAVGDVLKRFEYLVLAILLVAAVAFVWFRYLVPGRRTPAGP